MKKSASCAVNRHRSTATEDWWLKRWFGRIQLGKLFTYKGVPHMQVVILTRSAMHGANCVATVDSITGEFKRLVKRAGKTTVPLDDQDLYSVNTHLSCDPLDLVEISILEERPHNHQSENVVIDTKAGMKLIRPISLNELQRIHPPESNEIGLLATTAPKVSISDISSYQYSLELRRVSNLMIEGHKSPKAEFSYSGRHYRRFSVTDTKYYRLREGERVNIGDALVVFSLAEEPYDDGRSELAYYKFLAAIYPV